MPSRWAVAFISSANFGMEPPTPSASTTAMSFAEWTSIILSVLSTVSWVPTLKPILEGCWASAVGLTVNTVSRVMRWSRIALRVT